MRSGGWHRTMFLGRRVQGYVDESGCEIWKFVAKLGDIIHVRCSVPRGEIAWETFYLVDNECQVIEIPGGEGQALEATNRIMRTRSASIAPASEGL